LSRSAPRATDVQRESGNGALNGRDRPRNKKADPGFPRSATIRRVLDPLRNRQVIGSSPIAGSTSRLFKRFADSAVHGRIGPDIQRGH